MHQIRILIGSLTLLNLVFSASAGLAPDNGTIINTAIHHCPFNIKTSLANDVSSLSITYSPTESQQTLFTQGKIVCYVRVQFTFQPDENLVGTREIEYEYDGDVEGTIETKTVWDMEYGPTHFTPITLSGASLSHSQHQLSTNTTPAGYSDCGQRHYSQTQVQGAELNVQTTFTSSATIEKTGTLTQKFKLYWWGYCEGVGLPPCDYRDVDGNTLPRLCNNGVPTRVMNAADVKEVLEGKPDVMS